MRPPPTIGRTAALTATTPSAIASARKTARGGRFETQQASIGIHLCNAYARPGAYQDPEECSRWLYVLEARAKGDYRTLAAAADSPPPIRSTRRPKITRFRGRVTACHGEENAAD